MQNRSLWSARHECVQNDALFDFAVVVVHLAECAVPTDQDVSIRSASAAGPKRERKRKRARGYEGKTGLDCLF